jgi:hypothetical protein
MGGGRDDDGKRTEETDAVKPADAAVRRESEVGMAMHQGHLVYFVVFFPEPCPGQSFRIFLTAPKEIFSEVCR